MKMYTLRILVLLAGIPFLVSCDRDRQPSAFDFIAFGTFYGECVGEQCVEIYRLEDGHLFENTADMYPGSQMPLDGDYTELSGALYDAVKDMIGPLPAGLRDTSATVIGQPDAGDWGGAYLEWTEGSYHKFWLLDLHLGNVPSQYHPIIGQIQAAVARINE